MVKLRKTLLWIFRILTHVFTVLFGLTAVGGTIALNYSQAINDALGIPTVRIEQEEDDEDDGEERDTTYFKSAFQSVREVRTNAEEKIREVVQGGTVLLKNDNEALPLSSGAKVNLYSVSSVDIAYSGNGSNGENVGCKYNATQKQFTAVETSSAPVSLKAGLEQAGLTVNAQLNQWYLDNYQTYQRKGPRGKDFNPNVGKTIGDAPWSAIGSAKETNAEAGIFVLTRMGGEGADMISSDRSYTDFTNGDYLQLSANEKTVLAGMKGLKESGKLQKIVVLVNSANPVQCDFMTDSDYGVDAALWIGLPGTTGLNAVGDLLAGKNGANPSGRLTDTFWKKNFLNPVLANFNASFYAGGHVKKLADDHTTEYVVYQEGIYNGYKYTETRYEDKVCGTGNAGDYAYADAVAYPFGYGLSYTTFTYSNFTVGGRSAKGEYPVSLTVKNTGSKAGREVVQIYLQKPYTQYDKTNGVEKAAVELVGFAKTGTLAAGKSEQITVNVPERYFASYDAAGKGTYILEAGNYYLTAGKDAHDAVNNVLSAKGKTTANGMTASGTSNLVKTLTLSESSAYSKSATGASIVNRFDNADLNRYEGSNTRVEYLSRKDWAGTLKLGLDANHNRLNNEVKITDTERMGKDAEKPTWSQDDEAYPAYGVQNGLTLASFIAPTDDEGKKIPFAYNDPLWEELLDEMSWNETVDLLSKGMRMTGAVESVAKPQTIDHNALGGPVVKYGNGATNNGLAVQTNDPKKDERPAIYPCNGLVASTYDRDLVESYGVAIGEDCLWAGYAGMYGPGGVNVHRGPYGGRAYEYYSEDATLIGLVSSAELKGIYSKGVYCYLKHCILNDEEVDREGICVWANEQTIREGYLRAYEIVITENDKAGTPVNVMSGFNRLGVIWNGHHGYFNTILRGEFGMTGLVVSDWYDGPTASPNRTEYMTRVGAILAGNDLVDGSYSKEELQACKTGYGEVAQAMRESAHRILYAVANSNAMNGYDSNTVVIKLTPAWEKTVKKLQVAMPICFGVIASGLVGILVWDEIERAKARKAQA